MKRILFTSLSLLALILISGCTSKPIKTEVTSVTKQAGDVTFSLRYLPESELKSMYKDPASNVFADYPGRIQPKKSVMFDMFVITKTSSIKVKIEDISLTIGSTTGISKTQERLLWDWRPYLAKDHLAEAKAKKMVRDKMFPDSFSVTPSAPIHGWLAFLANYPNEGSGLLTIKYQDESGQPAKVDIPLDFFIDK